MQKISARLTASNYYVSQFYHLAKKKGLDADQLLRDAGVSIDVVDLPGGRVQAEQLALVVEGLWDGLQDEAMGLSSSPIPRGSIELMGKLLVHEPDLSSALILGSRFVGMVTQAYKMELETKGRFALLKFRLKNPEMDSQHLLAELILMLWHRFSSWLIADNIVLQEVLFDFPDPPQVSEYAYLFPGKNRFCAPCVGFRFSRRLLDYKVVQTPHTLETFIENCPADLFLKPKTDFSLSGEVKQLLKKHVADGFPSLDSVAERLHMTKRTLIRKLKAEGISYQSLKDHVRRDMAAYLLRQHSLSVLEVAEQVGFSDASVFARAFRTWMGVTPTEYREGLVSVEFHNGEF